MNWTITKVKDELPPVKVRGANGKLFDGYVIGRLNQFATVVVNSDAGTATFEFAWGTIANALNAGRTLTL
jgi:hypothetical protein